MAQMRAEYLTRHKALQSTIILNGSTTAQQAGLNHPTYLQDIPKTIWNELIPEMAQHQLHPRMIEAPLRQRCQELELEFLQGRTVGEDSTSTTSSSSAAMSARERALAAAEERRKQHEQHDTKQGDNDRS